MQAGDHAKQARALLLAARCPACAELLDTRALFGITACTRCDTQIDTRSDAAGLVADVRKRGRRQLVGIALAVGAVHLVIGWVPLLGALVLVLATAWIRVGILQPASAVLSPRRRVLTRWTARLLMAAALVFTVIMVEALTLLPVLGLPLKAMISSVEVALAAWVVTAYVHWQVEREAAGTAIATWERVLLGMAVAMLLIATFALALAFAGMASLFESVLGWLR